MIPSEIHYCPLCGERRLEFRIDDRHVRVDDFDQYIDEYYCPICNTEFKILAGGRSIEYYTQEFNYRVEKRKRLNEYLRDMAEEDRDRKAADEFMRGTPS